MKERRKGMLGEVLEGRLQSHAEDFGGMTQSDWI
jgi:hypothetical protein